jgi:hypothetical protein
LYALLAGFGLFRYRLAAGGILDGGLPLRKRLLQNLVAPLDKRPDTFIGLPVRLNQRFQVFFAANRPAPRRRRPVTGFSRSTS